MEATVRKKIEKINLWQN